MPFHFPNLIHKLSTKTDSSMKIEHDSIDPKILENRKNFFLKNTINPENVLSAQIVHGIKIALVTSENKWQIIPEVDGLITNETDLVLSVTIADCVPIYFYDDVKKVIWIAHAWWRWIVNGITKSMIDKFVSDYDSNHKDIYVYIGPHIQKCHFEVKDDIISKFDKEFIIKENWVIKVDLLSMIKKQFLSLWLSKYNITSSIECTYCESDKYFSYRRDKPEKVEAMIGVIGMRK